MRYIFVFIFSLFLILTPGCSFDLVKQGMEGAGVNESEVVEMFIFLFKTLKELKTQNKEGAFIKMLDKSATITELSVLLKDDRVRQILFENEELSAFINENPEVYVCLVRGRFSDEPSSLK